MAVMTASGAAAYASPEADARQFAWDGLDILVTEARSRLEPAWQSLLAYGTASTFQSPAFLAAWQQTAATPYGETLVYIAGFDRGEPAFVLPMALTRRLGARVLIWAGQSHANYGMGIFRPDIADAFVQGMRDIDSLIMTIARAVKADIVLLRNQPARWAGRDNPFARSRRAMQCANDTFVVQLDDDFQGQYKRLFSGRTLSNLKRKQRKLDDFGKVALGRSPASTRTSMLDWFFATKTAQLAQSGRGSPFAEPAIQDLYRLMSRDEQRFDLDALTVDDTPVAVGLTARDERTAYLLNSVHRGAEYARCSPGALLLHRMVAQSHAAGARVYDFGPGDLPYKREWEPEVVPLLFSVHLVNPMHLGAYAALVFFGIARATAKRSPRLSAWVRNIRTWFATAKGEATA